MNKILTLSILFLSSFTLVAQSLNDFSLINVIDGQTVTLKNYSTSTGIVIIFMINNCPFDDYYTSRIKSLNSARVPVLLINAHPDPAESVDNMSKRATQLGFTCPYLADKDQVVMQNLGAYKSTEAYLLKNTNGKFSVVYRGAIDDNPQVAGDVKHRYLQDAVDKLVAGQAIEEMEVRPTGCNIRKK